MTYNAAIKFAEKRAATTGLNYFVFEDRDQYLEVLTKGGRRTLAPFKVISEPNYNAADDLPEGWVVAYVGSAGVIESY